MDTHTQAHMRLFPIKPRRWPERGSVQSIAAAGELQAWQGKAQEEDVSGTMPTVSGSGASQ